jgi:hypothetical protein
VALPVEHGGWGFLLEPLVLGLFLAPSPAGLALAVAALGAFLTRQPLRLALADRRRGARYPRTAAAEAFAVAYGLVAVGAFTLAVSAARAPFWLPLVLATPFGLAQLAYDVRHRGRELAPELAGAIALGATVSAVVLAGGWERRPALALWLIMAARAAASVLYIRARLRLDRGLHPALFFTWASHLFGLAAVTSLAALGFAPWLAVLAFVALLIRAAHGLSGLRRQVRPQVVGFREMAFGALTVVLVALGYTLGF